MSRQPNSHHCFVCGLQNLAGLKMVFYDNGADEVTCTYTVPAQYEGYPGIVHGGIVASMLDEAVGRVSMIHDPNHFMMTVKMEIKYRQPVPTETPLTLVGKLVKLRGRLAMATGEVRLPSGEVAAEAELTLADLPEQFKVSDAGIEALGWKVYEE